RLPYHRDLHSFPTRRSSDLSTTPLDPRVLDAMLPTLREDFGNAASVHHAYGHRAEDLVEQARVTVAALIGAEPKEIIFTSGATEDRKSTRLNSSHVKISYAV